MKLCIFFFSLALLSNIKGSLKGSVDSIELVQDLRKEYENKFGVYIKKDFTKFLNVMNVKFETFMKKYGKKYTNEAEKELRLLKYATNYLHVQFHNLRYKKGKETFTLALNHLSDRFSKELSRLNGFRLPTFSSGKKMIYESPKVPIKVPESFDWRDKGAVTHVKNEGECNSSYAFSAIGALEGQSFIKHGKLLELSVQEIIDCSKNYANEGCTIGYPISIFNYVKDFGISSDIQYPYKAKVGKCNQNKTERIFTDEGCIAIPLLEEEKLKEAVFLKGPISVGIKVGLNFLNYKSGVFTDTDCEGKALDRAVLIVGYGVDKKSSLPYWIVKNSQGTEVQNKGYINMLRGKNLCGIALHATYPIVL